MTQFTKEQIQQRVLQNGKPLDLDKFTWDKKAKTFSTAEDNLVLDFKGINNCTFITGSYCTFDTGDFCTFTTGWRCTFDTGSGCTFITEYGCTFTITELEVWTFTKFSQKPDYGTYGFID